MKNQSEYKGEKAPTASIENRKLTAIKEVDQFFKGTINNLTRQRMCDIINSI